MEFLQAAAANILSLVAFGCVIAGVMKCFQIANELGEIKQVLKEIRRISEGAPAPGLVSAPSAAGAPQSPQALMRALDADAYAEAIHRELAVQPPPLQPEVISAAPSDSSDSGVHGA